MDDAQEYVNNLRDEWDKKLENEMQHVYYCDETNELKIINDAIARCEECPCHSLTIIPAGEIIAKEYVYIGEL